MSMTPVTDDIAKKTPWLLEEHARKMEQKLYETRDELIRAMRVVNVAVAWSDDRCRAHELDDAVEDWEAGV